MIDIERAIMVLENERECCNRSCVREECGKCDLVMDADWLADGLDDAIQVLREQGQKVKARRDGENGVWCCGACGHPVFPSLLEKYCPGCGKAVDYSE